MPPKYLTICLLACLTSAACATTEQPIGLSPDLTVTNLSELPAPRVEALALIDPLDRVLITVVQDEAISGTYVVDDTGSINFPYIDRVQAAGLTPIELALSIQNSLGQGFFVNPAVNVVPSDATAPSVSVGGQVNSPGSYPARDSLTLLRAVNRAGGLSTYAKLDDVLIFRTVAGENYVGAYNIGAINRGNYTDPRIYPGDIVMVGDNTARRRFESILGAVTAGLSTLVLVDRVAN
jgi:polysaccharide export outer membrane protein